MFIFTLFATFFMLFKFFTEKGTAFCFPVSLGKIKLTHFGQISPRKKKKHQNITQTTEYYNYQNKADCTCWGEMCSERLVSTNSNQIFTLSSNSLYFGCDKISLMHRQSVPQHVFAYGSTFIFLRHKTQNHSFPRDASWGI